MDNDKDADDAGHAPLALFVYNRPEHTRRTLDALKANYGAAETDLIVFSDGPKSPESAPQIGAVRELVLGTKGFKSLRLVSRTRNMGLAESVIDGVSSVCSTYGKIIVLEDDMLTSPWFLTFMNDALDVFRDDEDVISIHGYLYPMTGPARQNFFLRGADCWGWATWSRGWKLFEPDGGKLLAELRRRSLVREFDYNDAYPFYEMLEDQINGLNDSWAIRWVASAYLANRLTLYPRASLVYNIGNDSSGTHVRRTDRYAVPVSQDRIEVRRVPIQEDLAARAAVAKFLRAVRGGLLKRAVHQLLRQRRKAMIILRRSN